MAPHRFGLCSGKAYERGELRFDTLAAEVVRRMGLDLRGLAQNPQLDPNSAAARSVWEAFTELVEYQLYLDLQRGGGW